MMLRIVKAHVQKTVIVQINGPLIEHEYFNRPTANNVFSIRLLITITVDAVWFLAGRRGTIIAY